ncbi:hypothetical protein RY27_21135, partial [Litorilinea aerophila]
MLPANKIAPIFLTLVAALVLSGCALLPSGGLADRAAAEEPTHPPPPTPVLRPQPTAGAPPQLPQPTNETRGAV